MFMAARDPLTNRLHRRVQACEGPWQKKLDAAQKEAHWWQNEVRLMHFEIGRLKNRKMWWKIAFWVTLLTIVTSKLI